MYEEVSYNFYVIIIVEKPWIRQLQAVIAICVQEHFWSCTPLQDEDTPINVLDFVIDDQETLYFLVLCKDESVQFFHWTYLLLINPAFLTDCIELLTKALMYEFMKNWTLYYYVCHKQLLNNHLLTHLTNCCYYYYYDQFASLNLNDRIQKTPFCSVLYMTIISSKLSSYWIIPMYTYRYVYNNYIMYVWFQQP